MTTKENWQKVVHFVQVLLLEEGDRTSITPALIAGKIDMVVAMTPKWGDGLDRDAVTDELIKRFSLWIGSDTTLKNDVGHVAWLNAARKQDWRYWQRYREWFEGQLSLTAADALDRSTDAILGLLEDPVREDSWDRRGLVVGHVQSGKTGSYTGLICKAADAGYKIIVVLAGMHNNLRSQTQIRLDEGFLGYATNANPEIIDFIGVGAGGCGANIKPNCATNRSEGGDFNTKVANHLAITPEQRPWLFVVKKNKTVLTRLLHWIRNHAANTSDPATGRKIVTHLPLLIIDDEADHASVDTGEQLFDADGLPDEEHQPKAINSLIRKIVHSFTRSAFVGYTATPFANIFIHERGETREEGPDLFPAAFIINLAAPSNYVGPARIFGLNTPEGRQGGLPLVRQIQDESGNDGHEAWMPLKHKNGHCPRYRGLDVLPPSLVEAIDAFLLACVVRKIRGQDGEHSSMLVHVTRFTSVQTEVHRQVDEQMLHLRQRLLRGIDHEPILDRLRTLWERDFLPTTEKCPSDLAGAAAETMPPWERVEAELAEVVADVQVRMINGKAKDALDYAEQAALGLKVIAIGGDKLARGLTLEGLCCSYFLRASKMYDTLMQMGRWFGYRPGYLDLCRLYTTSELMEWFGHITDAADELREEFDLMADSGATPREYGLKVQSHPVLMVTSQLKMRTAKNLRLSFSGQLLETVALHRDPQILSQNLDAARRLIRSQGDPLTCGALSPEGGELKSCARGFVLRGVPANEVVDFLLAYRTHPAAYRVNSAMLAEFVKSMAGVGELTAWTVVVIGVASGTRFSLLPGVDVGMSKRTENNQIKDRYSIGRLLDPEDEAIDLTKEEKQAALSATRAAWKPDPARLHDAKEPVIPNGPAIRLIRGFGADGVPAHPERGLLLLYILDPKKAAPENQDSLFVDGSPPVIAFAISFPASDSGVKVEYKVNNILWEQEYGAAD
jgi:hypothetical protein